MGIIIANKTNVHNATEFCQKKSIFQTEILCPKKDCGGEKLVWYREKSEPDGRVKCCKCGTRWAPKKLSAWSGIFVVLASLYPL